MKKYSLLSILFLITIFVSACGSAPATPAITVEDVQATALAAALTAVAQTQTAIPTNTPLPPTETPTQITSPTLFPTLEATFTSTAAPQSSGGGDPCATRVLSWSPKGRETTIQIVNTVKAQVTVSLYLNETASWGECGYRSYNLGSRDSVLITDLVQGCYNLWAFNSDPKNPVNASGGGCINNSDKWIFEITAGNIKFTGP